MQQSVVSILQLMTEMVYAESIGAAAMLVAAICHRYRLRRHNNCCYSAIIAGGG